jgi:hypothetical protein
MAPHRHGLSGRSAGKSENVNGDFEWVQEGVRRAAMGWVTGSSLRNAVHAPSCIVISDRKSFHNRRGAVHAALS